MTWPPRWTTSEPGLPARGQRPDHEHHQRAAVWASGIDCIALCPIVEGALVRFLVRLGHGNAMARALLTELHASPRCVFWPDSTSYRDADRSHVVGRRQVTDACLVALAAQNCGLLATFDGGLAQAAPRNAVLIP